MDEKHAFLVVMAGGSGTRFWPKSTSKKPKQFLSFGPHDSGTLLAQTLKRMEGLVVDRQRMIVTTRLLADSVRANVPRTVEVLAEPQARNTAPCVYWAARTVYERDPEGVMAVFPADHYIADVESFRTTLASAIEWVEQNPSHLCTLGIRPTRPETGYGYLKVGKNISVNCSRVDRFVEKPDFAKAQKFLAEENYLWNGGMFVWKAKAILAAFDEFMPEMKAAWSDTSGDVSRAYPKMTATSIDFGVMEKARDVVTFSLDCGWDDLGSWVSLENLADQNGWRKGRDVVTAGEVIAVDSAGNIVDAPGKIVALLGIENLVVVQTGNVLLVAPKDRAQDIRKIVDEVKKKHADLV